MLCRFFFEAEDGIRDLVRSRGLGDVYKRQTFTSDREENDRIRAEIAAIGRLNPTTGRRNKIAQLRAQLPPMLRDDVQCVTTVSYTHLTLPTSDLV